MDYLEIYYSKGGEFNGEENFKKMQTGSTLGGPGRT